MTSTYSRPFRPDLTDASGRTRHLLVGAGKDANTYIVTIWASSTELHRNNANAYQFLANALSNGAWSGSAYFNNTVYYGGVGDTLMAFRITPL